jgi:hypothetical protein
MHGTETAADIKKVKDSNLATDFWYGGEEFYSYDTFQPIDTKNDIKTKRVYDFANVVWTGTTKVGFGVKGKWVVAWYCAVKATPSSTTANKNNIGHLCKSSGINNCLNDKAFAAHNDKRMMHDTKPFKLDNKLAKTLQTSLDAVDNFTKP